MLFKYEVKSKYQNIFSNTKSNPNIKTSFPILTQRVALGGVERAGSETSPEMFFLIILGNDGYLKHEIKDYLDDEIIIVEN